MRPRTIILALLALVAVVFIAVNIDFESPKNLSPGFPEKLNTRIELRKSEDSIQYRFIEYSDDGERLVQIRTEFRDGLTVYDYFRGDGTLREETEYYPSEDADSLDLASRVLKRVSAFDATGKKIIERRSYRLNGALEILTRLRADQSWESEKFSEDGNVLLVRQVVNKYGLLSVREDFRADGTLARVVKEKSRQETLIVTYREDGFTPESMTTRKSSGSYGYGYTSYYQEVEYVLYHDNGIAVKMKVEYPWSSMTRVSYYGPTGNLLEKREYSEYGRFELEAYWPNGEKKFEQVWKGPGYRADRTDISQFKLDETTEYGIDGVKTREVTYWDNGNAKKIREFDGKNSSSGIIRKYREDGTLESEQEQLDSFEYGEEKKFEAEENIKADLPEEIRQVEDRSKPPAKSDLPSYDRKEDI